VLCFQQSTETRPGTHQISAADALASGLRLYEVFHRLSFLTLEELMGQLREQGVEKIEEVKNCDLEGNGHISVIKAANK
jgi:uncharacterized membrane protein YcaP (DUF421 family)